MQNSDHIEVIPEIFAEEFARTSHERLYLALTVSRASIIDLLLDRMAEDVTAVGLDFIVSTLDNSSVRVDVFGESDTSNGPSAMATDDEG